MFQLCGFFSNLNRNIYATAGFVAKVESREILAGGGLV